MSEAERSTGDDEARAAYEAARAQALVLLDGVERITLPASEPGVELAALDWGGEGELVVLHHANGFCGATLAALAAGLRDRYRVVALDARGHGGSTDVDPASRADAYRWEVLAEDARVAVEALFERTGRERVALGIGHSFGGALLLRVAQLMGDRFERLLLCDPVLHPPPTSPVTPPDDAPAVGEPPRGAMLAEATRRRRATFPDRATAYAHFRSRGLFANWRPEALALYVMEGLVDAPDGVRLACAPAAEAAIFGGGRFAEVVDAIEDTRARVLFVHAERGNFVAGYYETLARRIGDRARVTSEDLDHLFPMEDPERTLALAHETLASD